MKLHTPMFSTGVAAFLALLASIPAPAEAHTWIDCLDTSRTKIYDKSQEYIFGGAKSNGICDGYGAGYPGRGVADIGPAYTHKMLKDQAKAGASVCQNVDNAPYTGWRKRLVADAGVPIYFSYLPNGHIVKDKMARGTKHGVYWTGKVGSKLSKSSEMTAENLVDGRTMDFDDGNCGESLDLQGKPSGRAGDGKPCVGSFTIPQGTAPGIYHFVWYWTFYRDDGNYADPVTAKGYFGAAYSTCFEVEVKGASGNASVVNSSQSPASSNVASPFPLPSGSNSPIVTSPTPATGTVGTPLPQPSGTVHNRVGGSSVVASPAAASGTAPSPLSHRSGTKARDSTLMGPPQPSYAAGTLAPSGHGMPAGGDMPAQP